MATRIQAMLRRSKDLAAARTDLLARLEQAMQAETASTWMETSTLVRLACLARPGGPNRAELLHTVKVLLTSLTSGSGEDSYALMGLRLHAGVVQVQLKRICSYVVSEMTRCRWTLQASDRQEQDAALLKALFVLTDSAQWKAAAAAGVPSAARVCAEVVGSLVVPRGGQGNRSPTAREPPSPAAGAPCERAVDSVGAGAHHAGASCGLYASLRQVLCPSAEWKGAKGTVQAALLWTLAIRPLTSAFPPADPRQLRVAFAFAREFLSIPCVLSELPEALWPALLHHSVWPRIIFSLGTAAAPPPPPSSPSSFPSSSSPPPSADSRLAPSSVLTVLANVVQLTQKTQLPGLQLLYLSALQVLLLPLDAHVPSARGLKLPCLRPDASSVC